MTLSNCQNWLLNLHMLSHAWTDVQALHMRSVTDLSAAQVSPLLDGCNHRADSGIGQGQVQGLAGALHR
jgi:hypothetical protein